METTSTSPYLFRAITLSNCFFVVLLIISGCISGIIFPGRLGTLESRIGTLEQQLHSHISQADQIPVMLESLGRGGGGNVYKALDKHNGKYIAVKLKLPAVQSPNDLPRRIGDRNFLELKALQAIHSNYVVAVQSQFQIGHVWILVMDYVPGLNLREYIKKNRLTPCEFLTVAIQIAWGIRDIHSRSIIHRDLEPRNIMITDRFDKTEPNRKSYLRLHEPDRDYLTDLTLGTSTPWYSPKLKATIIDFGLAMPVENAPRTPVGTEHNSPRRLSPEQWNGYETDWRAFGRILFYLYTGEVVARSKLDENSFKRTDIPEYILSTIQKCEDYHMDSYATFREDFMIWLEKMDPTTCKTPIERTSTPGSSYSAPPS